jgi:IS5 family transposase
LFEKNWLIMKEWTTVDATIIHAPSSTKNEKKERDPEMGSTKKWNNRYFGMKTHIWVESDTWYIHSVEITSASVHDSQVYDELLHWNEKKVFGDKAYDSEDKKRQARKEDLFYWIINKNKIWHKLSNKQNKHNKKCSSIRARVEHIFQIIKCQWNYRKVRYKWLFKNWMQINMLMALANLYKARKILLTIM